jgi:solute carrier family 26 protein
MYVLRLGVLSFLLSESLVSGFTTGAAIHVFTSQLKDLLGIELPRVDGNFKLIKVWSERSKLKFSIVSLKWRPFQTYIEIFNQLGRINIAAIVLSTGTIILLLVNNEILKPRVAKRTRIPIPIELIVVVGGTLLSKYFVFDDNFNVILVGHIPLGLPEAAIPKFDLWQELLLDAVAISFVSYSITVSLALIFGQKLKYEIDFNQELLAMVSFSYIIWYLICCFFRKKSCYLASLFFRRVQAIF